MSTITPAQEKAIADYLACHVLPVGIGTEASACSIAAINLALTGELTDRIPACMSRVIGRWIIRVQDAMPHDIRNSNKWKAVLPLAAGTGRDLAKERQRRDLILAWMWECLAHLQPIADKQGFGDPWRKMLTDKTAEAEAAAKWAAAAEEAAAEAAAAAEEEAAEEAAAEAAAAAAAAAAEVAAADYWAKVDPCSLLEKLVNI